MKPLRTGLPAANSKVAALNRVAFSKVARKKVAFLREGGGAGEGRVLGSRRSRRRSRLGRRRGGEGRVRKKALGSPEKVAFSKLAKPEKVAFSKLATPEKVAFFEVGGAGEGRVPEVGAAGEDEADTDQPLCKLGFLRGCSTAETGQAARHRGSDRRPRPCRSRPVLPRSARRGLQRSRGDPRSASVSVRRTAIAPSSRSSSGDCGRGDPVESRKFPSAAAPPRSSARTRGFRWRVSVRVSRADRGCLSFWALKWSSTMAPALQVRRALSSPPPFALRPLRQAELAVSAGRASRGTPAGPRSRPPVPPAAPSGRPRRSSG